MRHLPELQHSSLQRLDDEVFLNSAQTRTYCGGVTAMSLWRWMRDPKVRFPRPIKIGGKARNYWRLGDIRAWQARQARSSEEVRPDWLASSSEHLGPTARFRRGLVIHGGALLEQGDGRPAGSSRCSPRTASSAFSDAGDQT
jgi:predicted DNA-binding transcriptional regulator AlpA